MRRGAIELSLNFLVILIISIAVLSFGFYFVKKVITKAEDTRLIIDSQLQKEIENMLTDPSKPVAIPYNRKTIRVGDAQMIGFGVSNVLATAGSEDDFQIQILFTKYYDETEQEIIALGDLNPNIWISKNIGDTVTIPKHDRRIIGMMFKPAKTGSSPVLKGTYVFKLTVKKEDDVVPPNPPTFSDYADPAYLIYVVVP
ncbi:MAG: hypothetical protein V1735_06490 [Nanoarchaeota archaeon]